ncbi:hypothetical protein GR925_30765 [Streptomyces sp. HUCO-GS316]|nr:hypothetical protein [Streptomyces sp. HUCO-GS316]MXM67701.1 hypothetical protein [Streptomyces sp. HUCO-GS316]
MNYRRRVVTHCASADRFWACSRNILDIQWSDGHTETFVIGTRRGASD